jgi:ADP-ribosyl-[dinitrogen reductase] hydrolase
MAGGAASGSISFNERVHACLYGGAIGDAFGYEVEFDRYDRILARFGERGLQQPVLRAGKLEISDDTQMTLFTLEGLLRCPPDRCAADAVVASINLASLDWYITQGHADRGPPQGALAADPALHQLQAPGATCLSALAAGGMGSPEVPLNNSKGCGGVMRVAPVAFWTDIAVNKVFDLAVRSAALTHGHPSGYYAAGAMALLVSRLLHGERLDDAIATVLVELDRTPRAIEVRMCLREVLWLVREPRDSRDDLSLLGEGWVGDEALAVALYAVLVGDSFQRTIQIAANHDGDSDSTASLAGQLWGAAHGLSDIPATWISALDVRHLIEAQLAAWPLQEV